MAALRRGPNGRVRSGLAAREPRGVGFGCGAARQAVRSNACEELASAAA